MGFGHLGASGRGRQPLQRLVGVRAAGPDPRRPGVGRRLRLVEPLRRRTSTLAAELGQNAHKLSIEWSRIETRAGRLRRGQRCAHYEEMLATARRLGLKTFVDAAPLHEPAVARGDRLLGERRQRRARFARSSRVAAERLGHLVDAWITVNEPMLVAAFGYVVGYWPPERTSWRCGPARGGQPHARRTGSRTTQVKAVAPGRSRSAWRSTRPTSSCPRGPRCGSGCCSRRSTGSRTCGSSTASATSSTSSACSTTAAPRSGSSCSATRRAGRSATSCP